jgi:hypothetical protein
MTRCRSDEPLSMATEIRFYLTWRDCAGRNGRALKFAAKKIES